jgi:hypothetical protein
MALIVETGAVVAGADSYVTLAEATTYHEARGNTAWAGAASDALRDSALRRATVYIDQHYYGRWKGTPPKPLTQCLQWPRSGVRLSDPSVFVGVSPSFYDVAYSGFLPDNVIPQRLKDACCEAALRELSSRLSADQKRGGKVQSVTIGPITQSFSADAPGGNSYPVIDQLLVALLNPRGSITLERS